MQFVKIGSSYPSTKLPKQFSNQIYYSENSALNGFTYQSTFSLKYILSGQEGYLVQGRERVVEQGEHLLVNNQSEVTTLFAKGKALSIFVAPETLADVHSILQSKSIENCLDNIEPNPCSPIFRGKVYARENQRTEKLLASISRTITNSEIKGNYDIDCTIFFQLSEMVLLDQQTHSNRLNNLSEVKSSTLQEQYDRLMIGFQYLQDNWNQSFSLHQTAAVACLSPYHFHRLFKKCFTITPYQYHLQIQMKKAVELLDQQKYSILEISFQLGYNSQSSFGRVFKKYFGYPPSYHLGRKNSNMCRKSC